MAIEKTISSRALVGIIQKHFFRLDQKTLEKLCVTTFGETMDLTEELNIWPLFRAINQELVSQKQEPISREYALASKIKSGWSFYRHNYYMSVLKTNVASLENNMLAHEHSFNALLSGLLDVIKQKNRYRESVDFQCRLFANITQESLKFFDVLAISPHEYQDFKASFERLIQDVKHSNPRYNQANQEDWGMGFLTMMLFLSPVLAVGISAGGGILIGTIIIISLVLGSMAAMFYIELNPPHPLKEVSDAMVPLLKWLETEAPQDKAKQGKSAVLAAPPVPAPTIMPGYGESPALMFSSPAGHTRTLPFLEELKNRPPPSWR